MSNKILFLDFDGVLFDTMQEVYLINRYVYNNTDIKSPVDKKNYTLYSKYKYLVYNIWMFYYYNPLIFNEVIEKEIPERFNNLIKNRNKMLEERFCREFLEARYQLVNNHFEFWKNLEIPYDFFYGIKKLYENINPEIVIVSKKNKNSIFERFQTYDFNLNKDKIFAREILDNYSSKGDFIKEYMLKNNFDSAIFVDDNINNLNSTRNNPKIKNILALWGNTEPNSQGFSQKEALDLINNYFISK